MGRWREQNRGFCSFSLWVSDEKKWNADREIASVDVARHIAVMQGYLFEGLDQWVHPPWEGEESVWAANHYPRWKMRPYLSCRRSTRKAVWMRSCSSDEPDPSWPLGLDRESGWTSLARRLRRGWRSWTRSSRHSDG